LRLWRLTGLLLLRRASGEVIAIEERNCSQDIRLS
jgi:hypothetical protein